jgi:tRNA/rRNA methyltransferase
MKFTVVLVRPKNPENIGLVARSMKNTGFDELRLVGVTAVDQKSYVTAVHALDILERARFYPGVSEATADLDMIFASTSKARKNFPLVSLKDAVAEMFQFPASAKVGLLFGNERTGLTSEELRSSNFRFMIPQAVRQPSYNLASAVLLTLFHIFAYDNFKKVDSTKVKPLSRIEQEEFIRLILRKLEQKNFIHSTNKRHMTEMIYDLFGRFALTSKDRKLLLALFSKAVSQ